MLVNVVSALSPIVLFISYTKSQNHSKLWYTYLGSYLDNRPGHISITLLGLVE